MKTVVFSVPDISCGHCEMTIKKALQHIMGVKKTSVDLKKKLASIQFDETSVSIDKLSETIADAGYQVAGTV